MKMCDNDALPRRDLGVPSRFTRNWFRTRALHASSRDRAHAACRSHTRPKTKRRLVHARKRRFYVPAGTSENIARHSRSRSELFAAREVRASSNSLRERKNGEERLTLSELCTATPPHFIYVREQRRRSIGVTAWFASQRAARSFNIADRSLDRSFVRVLPGTSFGERSPRTVIFTRAHTEHMSQSRCPAVVEVRPVIRAT